MGVGERVGNAALDQVLVNLKLMGEIDNDLSKLGLWVSTVSEACHRPIPASYPVFGADAFRTATGVHAAAVIKALRKQDDYLIDRVYSGVPASWFGKAQQIEIGHMSGLSNVTYWLEQRGIEPDENLCKFIFEKAKSSNRTLTDEEVNHLIRDFQTR
jgi:2-isopropylmalate synthase